jgi:hypothetical protein
MKHIRKVAPGEAISAQTINDLIDGARMLSNIRVGPGMSLSRNSSGTAISAFPKQTIYRQVEGTGESILLTGWSSINAVAHLYKGAVYYPTIPNQYLSFFVADGSGCFHCVYNGHRWLLDASTFGTPSYAFVQQESIPSATDATLRCSGHKLYLMSNVSGNLVLHSLDTLNPSAGWQSVTLSASFPFYGSTFGYAPTLRESELNFLAIGSSASSILRVDDAGEIDITSTPVLKAQATPGDGNVGYPGAEGFGLDSNGDLHGLLGTVMGTGSAELQADRIGGVWSKGSPFNSQATPITYPFDLEGGRVLSRYMWAAPDGSMYRWVYTISYYQDPNDNPRFLLPWSLMRLSGGVWSTVTSIDSCPVPTGLASFDPGNHPARFASEPQIITGQLNLAFDSKGLPWLFASQDSYSGGTRTGLGLKIYSPANHWSSPMVLSAYSPNPQVVSSFGV